jgi:hypothetical protein
LSATYWEYTPPPPESPAPLVKSLDALLYELPKDIKTRTSLFQRTLHFLSDFTGEISAQVYLPYRPSTMVVGIPPLAEKSSIEDELRREIRALKGLVLNRYYFILPLFLERLFYTFILQTILHALNSKAHKSTRITT